MASDSMDRRDSFLLEMYRQTSSHLNRHILLSWQSIGVVGGALAVFVLGDKPGAVNERLDFAIAVVVLLCAWSIAHIYDANNWFERNLHIITNIERQFMKPSDARDIHFFFTDHRRNRSKKVLIEHLRIQFGMAVALWILLLAYHSYLRVWPQWVLDCQYFFAPRSVPYLATVVCAFACLSVRRDRELDHERLLKESPGITVNPGA